MRRRQAPQQRERTGTPRTAARTPATLHVPRPVGHPLTPRPAPRPGGATDRSGRTPHSPHRHGQSSCAPHVRGQRCHSAAACRADSLAARGHGRPEIRDAPYRLVMCRIPLRWPDENVVGSDGDDWSSRASRDAWHDTLVGGCTRLVVSGHTHYRTWPPATDEPLRTAHQRWPRYRSDVGRGRSMDRRRSVA